MNDRLHRTEPDAWPESPLALLIKDQRTQALLGRLSEHLATLNATDQSGQQPQRLVLRRQDIDYCRRQWEQAILRGEAGLLDFGTLVAWKLCDTRRIRMVARVVASPKKELDADRIVIEQPLARDDIARVTDHSLAASLARRYRYRQKGKRAYGKLYARASFLEHRPLESRPDGLATRIMTRVKVDDQIWNKVCDALFDIDSVVRRDKVLNAASKYIKDVFGVKVLTQRREDSYRVAEVLSSMEVCSGDLEALGGSADGCGPVELLETKDYLALPDGEKKKTGWEAIKNVYRWRGQVFEVQIQTEANYFLEQSDLSSTSHRTFEMQRQALRLDLAGRVPHYAEYRALLKALFKRRPGSRTAGLPAWVKVVP